ncbi:MAG: hypothetical protein QXP32_06160 [Nitrososphaeria archaeon]
MKSEKSVLKLDIVYVETGSLTGDLYKNVKKLRIDLHQNALRLLRR